MANQMHSMLIGAAIAAFVSLPANAGDSNWTTGPTKSFDVKSLKVDDVVGTLKIDVKDSGPITLQISGLRNRVDGLKIKPGNGALVIEGHFVDSVWDWSNWFDFSHLGDNKPDQLVIHASVPKGTPIKVDGLIGDATIASTYGKMKFSANGSTHSTIGNVSEAKVSLAGSGKVTLGDVAGTLSAETAGSGDIHAGNVGEVHADIAGSGSISTGDIARGAHIEIAGAGDFTAAGVNGSTHVEIAGSGSVNIAKGVADPLHVEIMGSGDVTFGGMAVDPHIEAMGSGNVKLKAYRGNLSNEGNANLKIGG
jgi:hypothetical protein